jgi:glycosyltransferase involved in cell wall biosynthesis
MKTYFIQDHEIFPYMPVERVAATYRLPFRKIVVSSWLRDVMTETYGARDVAVVANGVDLERFASSARHRPKPPVFGLLMSQSPRKNSGMALKAFKRAQSTRPDLRLLAFGVEPEPEAFRGDPQMRYCSMPDQDEIPCLYGSCTAWLFPSESEGFGLPILESMASGTPVIATRAGAAPDLVNETNGALVTMDADAMADTILRFAALSDEDWTAFSAAARSTAEAHDLRAAGQAFEAAILDEAGTAAAAG